MAGPRSHRWMGLPALISIIVLGIALSRSGGVDVILLLTVVLAWTGAALSFVGLQSRTANPAERAPRDNPALAYYARLLLELQERQTVFEQQRHTVGQTFLGMSGQLAKAVDLSRSTGLLAANAMMAAARCGEVGRGFVTVSRDLSAISDTAEQDLQTLYLLVTRLQARLSHPLPVDRLPPVSWLDTPHRLAACRQSIHELQEVLAVADDTVQGLLQRYQDEVRMDVRWLQLGDAVRRVLVDIADHLLTLGQGMETILASVRILSLAPSFSEAQLLELRTVLVDSEAA